VGHDPLVGPRKYL